MIKIHRRVIGILILQDTICEILWMERYLNPHTVGNHFVTRSAYISKKSCWWIRQKKSKWKLVIKLDITALRTRFEQLQALYLRFEQLQALYLKNIEKRCERVIAGNAQQMCANMIRILEKENIQLTASLEQLRILYNSNTNKRG